MTHKTRMLLVAVLSCSSAVAVADAPAAPAAPACPKSLSDAAIKAFPGAKVTKCREGKDHSVVHLEKKDGTKAELELSPKGDIQETEEEVAVTTVPAAVTKAFAARYPKLKATKAEKNTKADKSVSYELAAGEKDSKTEASFKDDGTFLEEEAIVAPSTLPAAVTKAFAAKYPKAKATRVEKQTSSDNKVTFEIAFDTDKGGKEATFKNDGSFVEEE